MLVVPANPPAIPPPLTQGGSAGGVTGKHTQPQVTLQQSLEALEDELHTARSSRQDAMNELGALKSTMGSQEQLVKVSCIRRIAFHFLTFPAKPCCVDMLCESSGELHAHQSPAASRGGAGMVGVSTRPARLLHPWGATRFQG